MGRKEAFCRDVKVLLQQTHFGNCSTLGLQNALFPLRRNENKEGNRQRHRVFFLNIADRLSLVAVHWMSARYGAEVCWFQPKIRSPLWRALWGCQHFPMSRGVSQGEAANAKLPLYQRDSGRFSLRLWEIAKTVFFFLEGYCMTYLRVISHVADMRNSKHCRHSFCKRVVSLHRFEHISCRNGFCKTNGLVTGGFAKQRNHCFLGGGVGAGPGQG